VSTGVFPGRQSLRLVSVGRVKTVPNEGVGRTRTLPRGAEVHTCASQHWFKIILFNNNCLCRSCGDRRGLARRVHYPNHEPQTFMHLKDDNPYY
jgi:hypothetical protein